MLQPPSVFIRFAVPAALLAAFAIATSASAGVLDDWRELEQLATTPEARAALSREMINAVPRTPKRDDKLSLAQRAFELGAQSPQGYRWAAKALEWIQRTDPARRVWCLEQLRDMYTTASRNDPREAKYAAALGDVLEQLAEQRLLDIERATEAGRIDATHATEQLELAIRDALMAASTLKRASATARAQSRRVKASQPALSDNLVAMAAVLDEHSNDMRELQRRAAKSKYMWMRLLDAQQRFADSAQQDAARQLAMIYITDFDRPELMPLKVRQSLDEEIRAHVTLACHAVDTLTADEAMEIAKWYDQLARGAANESRPDLLIRTRVYFQRAQAAGNTVAKVLLIRVDQDLERNSVYRGTANRLSGELTARLNFLFAERPDDTAVAQADPNPTTPDQPTATDAGSPATRPVATDSGNSFGRPMVTCDTCGRRFFPGWGKTASTCPLCKSGHRNIFDFGNGN